MNRAHLTLGYVALTLVVAVLFLAVGIGTASAEHCDNDELTALPRCKPGHTIVDNLGDTVVLVDVQNWPAEYPAATMFANCDDHAALRPNPDGNGCVFVTQMESGQHRGFLWGIALGVVPLSALVIARLAR